MTGPSAERDALDEVERRVRALKRVGDPATHETVVQVVLSIVAEVRSTSVTSPGGGSTDDL